METEFSKMEFMNLVDVAGGKGYTISAISRSFPNIKCCNFDLPEVISAASSYADTRFLQSDQTLLSCIFTEFGNTKPYCLWYRCAYIVGDMFASVPYGNAIFMKSILHDWGDKECKKILKNCHKALPKEGKLILVEMVLPEPGQSKSSWSEEIGGIRDMIMLSATRGKERSEEQWKKILQESGFSRYNIIPLPSEPLQMSIIEAFPDHLED